ncbi:hypothetical protein [Streptomyces sp. NPDC007856]|uniref:hypothetical protein n=1 Tax=Streptomyces sp. NPDC007856 TaxID=3364781 RepID=UPI00369804E5
MSESALTGESAPVAKAAADLPEPLAGLGMTALPAPYHLLLSAVLGLCALALAVATTRHARRRP